MILIGTGAQAKYVFDILELNHRYVNQVFNLPNYKENGSRVFYHKPVLEFNIDKIDEYQEAVICCSDNFLKEKIYINKYISLKNLVFPNIIHPTSIISHFTTIDIGNIINANAVIQPEAKIGSFCMIHSGVIVEHDCIIQDFCNLAPGVILTGRVLVGRHTVINTGTIVAPNVRIGQNCIVGAGSLVLEDVPDNMMVYGHPVDSSKAKEIEISWDHLIDH
jgi:sugar O-acyltransferase (sialic acid O-acetyltransferase NeuD family)